MGSGFSAMWYDPARNGEGLQLEVLDNGRALVEWYTYDDRGEQRWLQGVGRIVHDGSGEFVEFPQLYVTHGGRFGPTFDPHDVDVQIVGNATLSFGDCNTGSFHYDAFGQSQTLSVERLTQTMGAGCMPINGVPGQPVMAYGGQSGSWYDASHSGEGFALQWMSRNQAIVTWYTYDTQGNQIWLLGIGGQRDGAIVFEHVTRTFGPHFGTAFDPARLQNEDWGSLSLRLDCGGGAAHYVSSKPEYGSGDLNLVRLTKLKQPDCPPVTPKLGDLYDIRWNELPIESGTLQDPDYVTADSIANDGTVAGRRNGHLIVWHPLTREWQDVPRALATQQPVFVSPDGSAVIANEAVGTDPSQPPDAHTLLWRESSGWQVLPGLNLSVASAVSSDFSHIAGTGRDHWDEVDSAWTQAVDGGPQELLPASSLAPGAGPLAVSNDGNTMVGIALRFVGDWPASVAVRWDNRGAPTILQNPEGVELATAAACNADCSIVFGEGIDDAPVDHPHAGEAWLLKNDGTFEFLGAPADASAISRWFVLGGAASDGSLAAGVYATNIGDAGSIRDRGFIWTEATGMVSVRALASELGIGDDDWEHVEKVSVSPNGRNILLSGIHARDPIVEGPDQSRAVVLQLIQKATLE
jgi:hypothetical protein